MIRHTIMFAISPNASEADIRDAFNGMQALVRQLPGIFSIVCDVCRFYDEPSINIFNQDMPQTATHCISIDFTDEAALGTFLSSPASRSARNELIRIIEGGNKGIFCFNLENPDI